jgi:hypothetical protein
VEAVEIPESLQRWQELFASWYEALNLVNLAARNTQRTTDNGLVSGYLTKGDDHWRVQKDGRSVMTVVISENYKTAPALLTFVQP